MIGPWEFPNDDVFTDGFRDISNLEFMLFTGLKDKNGKEIYEGDILNDPTLTIDGKPSREIVEWDEDNCGWSPFCLIDGEGDRVIPNRECWIVIGNVYENLELLK